MQSALKLDVLELKMSQCPGALPPEYTPWSSNWDPQREWVVCSTHKP